jgi:hypothetical protein
VMEFWLLRRTVAATSRFWVEKWPRTEKGEEFNQATHSWVTVSDYRNGQCAWPSLYRTASRKHVGY